MKYNKCPYFNVVEKRVRLKLSIVLNILENLKTGLIKNITIDKEEKKDKYKQKTNKAPLEDEFLAKPKSTGRYLSPQEFKNRLKKGN